MFGYWRQLQEHDINSLFSIFDYNDTHISRYLTSDPVMFLICFHINTDTVLSTYSDVRENKYISNTYYILTDNFAHELFIYIHTLYQQQHKVIT